MTMQAKTINTTLPTPLMKWLVILVESPDSIQNCLIAIQLHSQSLAICQVVRCWGDMRRNYLISCLSRTVWIYTWWLMSGCYLMKKNTLKIHK
jgi:hypothetical protein